MKRSALWLKAFVGAIVVAAGALLAMVGVFWLLDVLPLAGLLGLAAYYALTSNKHQSTHWR